MNAWQISHILLFVTNVFIVAFLVLKGWRIKSTRIFCVFTMLVTIWSVGGFIVASVPYGNPEKAALGWKIGYIGVTFMPVMYVHYIFSLLNMKRRWLLRIGYVMAAIFVYIVWFKERWFLGDLKYSFGEFYYFDWTNIKRGPGLAGVIYYLCFYWILLTYSFYFLVKEYIHTIGKFKAQLKYFIIGSMVGWFGAHGQYPQCFGINIYPYSNFVAAVYPCILVYGIFKYRLFDIKAALTRTIIFSGVYVVALGIPLGLAALTRDWLVAHIGGQFWFWPPWVLSLVSASAGPYVYSKLRARTETLLFSQQRKYQDILLQTSEEILTYKDQDELLNKIADTLFENVPCSVLGMYLKYGRDYELKVSRGSSRISGFMEGDDPSVSRLKQGKVVHDITMGNVSVGAMLPLGQKEEIRGILLMGEKESKEMYSPQDIEALTTLLNQASLALENIQHIQDVIEEKEEKNRLKKEMDLARRIQMSLLPQTSPLTEGLQIEGLLIPAKEVAGDYYDFISYSSHKVGVVVADVSGKGLDSGMVMSMTKSTLSPLAEQSLSPRELVVRLNRHLCKQLQSQKFISFIYAEYSSVDNTFTWGGGGHEHVIVYRSAQEQGKVDIEVIKTGGVVLGMFEDIEDKIPQQTVTLNRGDRIVLYTDGVTELKNPQGEMFSLKSLVKTIQNTPDLPVKNFLSHIQDQIQQFMQDAPQYDDITLVVLGRE